MQFSLTQNLCSCKTQEAHVCTRYASLSNYRNCRSIQISVCCNRPNLSPTQH
uniref:Uncharacterized protein n=1 Tax=Arundo donax TaxID=35708 RepID=A0A0A9G212_ARUDO